MNTDATLAVDGHKDVSVEGFNAEKQLWALIHSKGLLHPGVKDLCHKTRTIYESIVLNDCQIRDHDVEYSLWKLHYKHIDEFRRRLRKSSGNADRSTLLGTSHDDVDVQKNNDNHLEAFKLFLADATEYYKYLIVKIKQRCGLLEEPLFHKNDGISSSIGVLKGDKCRFSCHRFLVRLGDLARYKEFYEKSDVQSCNWSIATAYYLKATRIWPDSGNPHNQLAVLATYVGDEFLALYHCVRSLAVKEPFPDAWDNLILLLETNRDALLLSLSGGAHFNFFKPSERSNGQPISAKTELWSLLIRVTSFFYIKSRLDDFSCTFAATMRELEAVMALDDTNLKDSLESYQHMDATRTGPFRAVHIISTLISIIEDLIRRPELKESRYSGDIPLPVLTKLAWTVTFVCMARLVDRCSKGKPKDYCPLLPAVLVFSEWLVGMLDEVETCGGVDEESLCAISYFFGSFTILLSTFEDSKCEDFSPDRTALWEDYELQGFDPLARVHEALDFSAHHEYRNCFESGSMCRINRIIIAATKIVDRPNDSQKWILKDKIGRKFYLSELNKFLENQESKEESGPDLEVRGPHQSVNRAAEESEKKSPREIPINPTSTDKSVAMMDEEEVILFKPITRYNSAPISITATDHNSPELQGIGNDKTLSSEECLCCASSLFVAQNQARIADPSTTTPLSVISNFRCSKPPRPHEPFAKDPTAYSFSEGPISAGPPSLNAWVLNRGSLSTERGKVNGPNPNESASSVSLTALSIRGTEDAANGSGPINPIARYSSPPYSSPLPSAPLLPDDAVWYSGDSYSSGGTSIRDAYLNVSDTSGYYANWNADNGYAPLIGLNAFERFHHYKNDHNLMWGDSFRRPVHSNVPGNLRNLNGPDASRFGLFDHWGNPLASNSTVYSENHQPAAACPVYPLVYSGGGGDGQVREKLFHGFPILPSHYAAFGGEATDTRADEQQQLLQYLKDREWQLQRREPQLRGPPPTYIGN